MFSDEEYELYYFWTGNSLKFWAWTGLFCRGHVTYGKDVFPIRRSYKTFENPAEMIEELHNDGGQYIVDGMTDVTVHASIWAHAGWWDPEYKR